LRPSIEVIPEEIIIPKLVFGDVYKGEEGITSFRREAVRPVKNLMKNNNLRRKLEEPLKCPKLAMYDNADRIKYNDIGESLK
jgi:hypothetical protein